jgi:hypothetical protein
MTRQWRYKQRLRATIYQFLQQGRLRTCLWCRGPIPEDMRLSTIYCCNSCRVCACRARKRRRGGRSLRDRRVPRLEGLIQYRADQFYAAHGRSIGD